MKITVGISGTGGGFEQFCAGETDISDASRPIKDDEEVAVCEKSGVEYVEFQVANDGSPSSSTRERLGRLPDRRPAQDDLGARARRSSSWNEVDPSFPDAELELFGPGTDSGTFDYFTDVINGEEGASRKDYQAVRGRQRHSSRASPARGRPRLLRLLVLRGEPGQAEAWSRSTAATAASRRAPRRSRTARTRRSRARCSSTRSTKALDAARGRGVHAVRRSTTTTTIAEAAQIVPLTDEQARPRPRADARGSSTG